MTENKTDKVQRFMDSCTNSCEPAGYVAFQWSMKGIGFGSVGFYTKDGKVHCDNEMMSKQFVKEILCNMVDDCVMDIPNKKDI